MLDRKVKSLFHRAEEKFERESGWKTRDVKATLRNFSRLNRAHQALFGGLLVGRALFGAIGTDEARPPRQTRSRA